MGWIDKYSEDISKAQKGKFVPKREGFSRTQDNTAVDSKLFSKVNKDKKFKNKLTPEQQNQKAYQESKLQGEKELAKNWAQSSMQEAFKHPLMSPGYFTPEGVAVAALQGAVKLGPDLYNGEYLGAAEDALMMLPFAPKGFQAAKQAGKFLTEETALKNAYKLNPKAFKPKPDSYYRALGDTGYQDALESGVLRPKQTATDNWMMNNTDNRGKTWFSKGELITARDNPNILLGYKGPDMVEYSGKNLTESIPKRNRVYGSSDSQIPIDSKDVQFYREDWLKGYKKMPKNNFKSEIDWNSFNKSIPKNKLLMQEYNTIEQQAKANGSWMKNADGTQYTLSDGYVGSPEQFVQENSKNYKLAFGDKRPDTVYRGVQEGTTGDFSLSDEMGLAKERGMFTANKELADNYGASQGNPKLLSAFDEGNAGTYQLASKNNTQLTIDANAGSWTDIDLMPNYNKKDLAFNLKSGENQLAVLRDDLSQDPEMLVNYAQGIERKRRLLNGVDDLSYNNPEYKKLTDALGPESDTNEIAKYLQNTELNKFRINNVNDGGLGDVTIHNNKKGNYLKSLIGNNGEFDMNNPNIFKAIAPIIPAAGVAAAAQMQEEEVPQYQDGGEIQHQMPDGSMMDGNSHDDYNTAMRGMMKSKIGMGNTFNNPAIKRMSQSYPKQGMTPEGMGTHYMGSYGNEARPSLQDFGGEQLQYIENPKKGSPENIRFDRSQDAEYFAEHYKEVAPMTTIFKDVNKMQNGGGIIKDDRGQWDHPGEITQIQGGNITMQGVDYPVFGVSDTGEQQMMYPGEEYNFKGAKHVTEYPMMQDGGSIKKIESKGWLNKYENVPKAQKGKTISVDGKPMNTDSDEYRTLYKTGQIQNSLADGEDTPYFGGELNEVITTPKLKYEGCVNGMCHDYADANNLNYTEFRKMNNLYGSAWDVSKNMFGEKVDIQSNYNNLAVNDMINLSRDSFDSDKKNNIPDVNQHVGRISKIVNGVPYIKHYIDGRYYEEPINNISEVFKYKPTGGVRPSEFKNFETKNSTFKFDNNYESNDVEKSIFKGVNDKKNIQNTLKLDNDEYENLSKLAYGILGAESSFGDSKRMLYRQAVPDFLQKIVKVGKDVYNGVDNYDENINNLSQGYSSIKESSLHNVENIDKKLTSKQVNDKIRNGDYEGSDRSNNYLYYALQKFGLNADNLDSGENSFKATMSTLSWYKKRFPNATDAELLKKFTGKKNITAYKKNIDSYLANIDGNPNNNKSVSTKNKVYGKAAGVANDFNNFLKETKGNVAGVIRDALPISLNKKQFIADLFDSKAPITKNTLSNSEYNKLQEIVKSNIENNKKTISYGDYKTSKNANDDVNGAANLSKFFFNPSYSLKTTIGQASIKNTKDKEEYNVIDTFDYNDKGESFGILDDLSKRGFSPYNIMRAVGRNLGSQDGQGAEVNIPININKKERGGSIKKSTNFTSSKGWLSKYE
jgi:hypothetical protein